MHGFEVLCFVVLKMVPSLSKNKSVVFNGRALTIKYIQNNLQCTT